MIRINLLPYRAARKKENVRIQVNIFLGTIVFLVLAIFWYNSHLSSRINGLKTDIQDTKAQVAKYQAINKEIAEIKKKLEVVNRKIEVIEALESDRKAPVQNLDKLYSLLVEKRMWYTSVEEKGARIHLSGVAIDNQTVADFMTRLEKSERFDRVQLSAIKQTTVEGSNLALKQFDISFSRKSPTPNAPQDKK